MVIAGEADSRTPASEALQAFTALKLAGVEAALVRGPGVTHSSAVYRPSHFASEVACQLAWYRAVPETITPHALTCTRNLTLPYVPCRTYVLDNIWYC